MDSLRVETGTKRIEVNDAGECIEFCVTDSSFFEGFYELASWMEQKKASGSSIKNLYKENGSVDMNIFNEAVSEYDDMGKQIEEKIDRIFGAGSSKKIFCGHTPNIFTLSDFIEKISPFIKKYMKEKQDSLSKYSKSRKGAKS